MLVCPQCQFENPNTNKFCQKCGTSLTHKVCSECRTQVALNVQNCINCGAEVGTVWLAIISAETGKTPAQTSEPIPQFTATESAVPAKVSEPIPPLPIESPVTAQGEAVLTDPNAPASTDLNLDEAEGAIQVDESEIFHPSSFVDPASESEPTASEAEFVPASSDNSIQEIAAEASVEAHPASEPQEVVPPVSDDDTEPSTLILTCEFLDPQQRYKLLESLPQKKQAGIAESVVKVLDCQPFQLSPLAAIVGSSAMARSRPQPDRPPETITPPTSSNTQPNTPTLSNLAIPATAQPYLGLHSQFHPKLPTLHDAWQQNGQTVLLLEDRSDLPLLAEQWGNDEIPALQLLHWLYEMTELWAAFEPWHCRQSLLEETNLRVDEDENLCLQRLYPETLDAALTLSDLGQLWQMFFAQSQRTQLGSVTQMLVDCREGKFQTVDALRAQLVAIADEIEAASPGVPVDVDEDEEDMPTIVLPMQLVGLQSAGRTDIGRQRAHNEDYFGIETNVTTVETPAGRTVKARCLYILCDGMGGHAGGEVASAQAVETLREYFQAHWQDRLPSEASLREAVLMANRAIYDVNQKEVRSGSGRMGTTLVLVLVQGTEVAVAHVGDSRLYRLSRRQGLKQVTTDHEVGQREIKRGVDPDTAYARPDAYQLTQALGPRDEDFVHPDVQLLELNEDSLLILASDGLTDNDLLETHQQTHLVPLLSPDTSLEQGVNQLINLANQYNGHDNITAILIRAVVQPSKSVH